MDEILEFKLSVLLKIMKRRHWNRKFNPLGARHWKVSTFQR